MSRALVLGFVLAIGSSVSADQTAVSPKAATNFGSLRPTDSNKPYRTLFAAQPSVPSTPALPSKSVRCGMTIIEADPMFDSKIAKTLPKDGTRYTIRAVPPPVCGAPR